MEIAFGRNENAELDDVNYEINVSVHGIYSVFCSITAAAGSDGSVAVMVDGAMYSNTSMTIDGSHLCQSQMAIVELSKDEPVYLQVVNGSVILPDGNNANLTLSLIKNLA